MELLDERSQVRGVAKRWRAQYGEGTYGGDKRKRMVGAELAALDIETATAADVAEIVGNGSWVCMNTCHDMRRLPARRASAVGCCITQR